MSQQGKRHWKHTAIDKSGLLSDLWDVFIAIGGRAAGWILFGCMVCNILQIIPSIHMPEAVTNIVMVVQVLTLDIAGFGLNTIAKHVLKSTRDTDAIHTAESAKKLATFLIGLMMLTVGLITVGWLYAPAKPATDTIDHVLILARVILIVIYMHAMHDLRQVELEITEQEEQTAQANDQLVLDNQKRIDTLAKENRDLRSLVTDLCTKQATLVDRVNDVCTKQAAIVDKVNDLCTKQAVMVDTSAKSVDIDVYTGRLERLEKMFSGLNVTVTEVNQNVLQITQNLYNMPGEQQYTDRLPAPRASIVEAPEEAYTDSGIDALKQLDMPSLDVPGVTDEKVKQVLALYLKGTKWREIPGNYSRTIKPVKEAYEAYLSAQVDTGEQECIQAVDTPVYAR